jgi:hypothetical protein
MTWESEDGIESKQVRKPDFETKGFSIIYGIMPKKSKN